MVVSLKQTVFVFGLLLLAGCQSTPQADRLRQQGLASLPDSHTISAVPFYPQQQYYCGPTTLSEVFGYYGVTATPEEIAPKLFIPNKEGSLQLEMVSATRQYGFLPYTERGTLSSIMGLVKDDIPVIVFQNLSIALFPQWHYAVVIGFDSDEGTVTLHTGETANHEMSLELFERTWGRGNYWYLAPIPPDKTSNEMKPYHYTSAAYDMLKVGDKARALAFLETASTHWPSQWLSYFLIANYHMEQGDNAKAIAWFDKGFEAGKTQLAYLHNYALVLLEQGSKSSDVGNSEAAYYEENWIAKGQRIVSTALALYPDDDKLIALAKKYNDKVNSPAEKS
jgi:predicted double-glycine peptidase